MKSALCVLTFLFASLVLHASSADELLQKLTKAHNEFGWNLYRAIRQSAQEKNTVLSPFSIAVALSMVLEGTSDTTEIQLRDALKLQELGPAVEWRPTTRKLLQSLNIDKPMSTHGNFTLAVANKLYYQQDFKVEKAYVETLNKDFYADIQAVNFARSSESVRKEINKWVEDKTNDKIQDMFPAGTINSMTQFVLANAIYFKSFWAAQFNINDTTKKEFHVDEGMTTEVQMMFKKHKFPYHHNTELKLKMVELSYAEEKVKFVLLVPDERFGLNAIEAKLNADSIGNLLRSVDASPMIELSLPRFFAESSFSLSETLKKLGIVDLFDPARADLSDMTESKEKSMSISEVLHKVFVVVNEEGTEAAAATGVIGLRTSLGVKDPVQIIVDHPSLFFIVDRSSGSILFMGRIGSPSSVPSARVSAGTCPLLSFGLQSLLLLLALLWNV